MAASLLIIAGFIQHPVTLHLQRSSVGQASTKAAPHIEQESVVPSGGEKREKSLPKPKPPPGLLRARQHTRMVGLVSAAETVSSRWQKPGSGSAPVSSGSEHSKSHTQKKCKHKTTLHADEHLPYPECKEVAEKLQQTPQREEATTEVTSSSGSEKVEVTWALQHTVLNPRLVS